MIFDHLITFLNWLTTLATHTGFKQFKISCCFLAMHRPEQFVFLASEDAQEVMLVRPIFISICIW